MLTTIHKAEPALPSFSTFQNSFSSLPVALFRRRLLWQPTPKRWGFMHKLLEGRLRSIYYWNCFTHEFLFSPFIYIFKSFTHINLDLNVLHAAIMQFYFYFILHSKCWEFFSVAPAMDLHHISTNVCVAVESLFFCNIFHSHLYILHMGTNTKSAISLETPSSFSRYANEIRCSAEGTAILGLLQVFSMKNMEIYLLSFFFIHISCLYIFVVNVCIYIKLCTNSF